MLPESVSATAQIGERRVGLGWDVSTVTGRTIQVLEPHDET